MKKTAMILLTASLITVSAAPMTAFAAEDSVTVKLRISNDLSGTPVFLQTLTVTDTDGDGSLTPQDALYLAHEKAFPGGAEAGLGDGFVWGTRGTFVWELFSAEGKPLCSNPEEVENGTAMPLYMNELQEGCTVHCYPQAVYPDYYGFQIDFPNPDDLFYVFPTGTSLNCYTLFYQHDKKDPIPVPNIELRMNGNPTGLHSDADGKITLSYDKPGEYPDYAGYETNGQCVFESTYGVDILVMDSSKIGGRVNARYYETTTAEQPTIDTVFTLYDFDDDGRIDEFDALNIMMKLYPNMQIASAPLIDCPPLTDVRNDPNTAEPAVDYIANFRPVYDDTAAVAAAAITETAATTAVTTTTAAEATTTTTTTAITTASTSEAKSTAKTSASKTDNVKAGDTAMIPALIFAGLAGAGTAVFTARRKKQ